MAHNKPTISQPTIASALQNASFLAITRFYYLIIRSIYVVLLVKILGTELYGYYTYSQNWYVMLTPLAMWGMNEFLISEFIRCSPEARDRLVGTGLSLRALLGALCALGIVGAALLIEDVPQLQLLMIIYAQGVLARNLSSWFSALFVAQGKSHYWLLISITFVTLEVVLILFLASGGATLVTIALVQGGIWWSVVATAFLVNQARLHPVRWRWSAEFLQPYLRRGALIGSATFFMTSMPPGLLILYRQLAGNLQGLGEIALVLQILLILDLLILAVSNAILPALNRATMKHKTALTVFSLFIWNFAFFLGGALSLLGISLGPAAVSALPPTKFDEAALLLAQFSWIVVPLLIIHGFRLVLISTSHMRLFLAIMFTGFISMVALVFICHEVAGLDGINALASMGCAFAIIALLKVTCIRKIAGGLPLKELLFAPALWAACYLVLLSLPGYLHLLWGPVAAVLLLGVAAFQLRRYRTEWAAE